MPDGELPTSTRRSDIELVVGGLAVGFSDLAFTVKPQTLEIEFVERPGTEHPSMWAYFHDLDGDVEDPIEVELREPASTTVFEVSGVDATRSTDSAVLKGRARFFVLDSTVEFHRELTNDVPEDGIPLTGGD